jgi:hypothetical protein
MHDGKPPYHLLTFHTVIRHSFSGLVWVQPGKLFGNIHNNSVCGWRFESLAHWKREKETYGRGTSDFKNNWSEHLERTRSIQDPTNWVGTDIHNSIKENRKGGYCTEATRRAQDVVELSRGLAGRQYYSINNLCTPGLWHACQWFISVQVV